MNNFSHYQNILRGHDEPNAVKNAIHPHHPKSAQQLIQAAYSLANPCKLCFRRCEVIRSNGETGYCGLDMSGRVFMDAVLGNEERPLNPTYEIFLTGCNLRCGFCYQKKYLNNPTVVRKMSPRSMSKSIVKQIQGGALNLHWVGGEPTVNLPWILETISMIDIKCPIVWNSNMTMSSEALTIIRTFTDVFLADLHFYSSECAQRLSGNHSHIKVAKENIQFLAHQSNADLILRHLILPGHFDCCTKPLLEWIKETIPEITVHLMPQYLPPPNHHPDIPHTPLSEDEFKNVLDTAEKMKLRIYSDLPGNPVKIPPANVNFENEIIIHPGGRMTILYLSGDFVDFVDLFRKSNDNNGAIEDIQMKGSHQR